MRCPPCEGGDGLEAWPIEVTPWIARDFPVWEKLTEDDYREIGRRMTIELRTIFESKQRRRHAGEHHGQEQQQPDVQDQPSDHD